MDGRPIVIGMRLSHISTLKVLRVELTFTNKHSEPSNYSGSLTPNGKIPHAEISIHGSVVMIGDPDEKLYGEPRSLGHTSASLHIFVDDNEAVLRRALKAGAEQVQPPTEMFYGANSASLRDAFGHVWVLLTWKEGLDPAELERRGNTLLRQ